MKDLPAGTVTFLFTDVEGSTTLIRRLGDARYQQVHSDHHRLVQEAVRAFDGTQIDAQSESFFVSFATARTAISAAIAIQRAVAKHQWPDGATLRIRIGLHTGEPLRTGEGYVGMDVHRAARICNAGHGGQILLSQTTASLVHNDMPPGGSLLYLGEHTLKDIPRPERIFQLVHPDLPREFPALRSLSGTPNNLPAQLTTFVGREREMAEIRSLLTRSRLLTLTGPGGGGKTRLAIQTGAQLVDEVPEGIWLVELGALTDPGIVPRTVAADLGLRQDSSDVTAMLAEYLRERRALIVLDGCEHLLAASARLAETLLRGAPHLRILATSRQPLGVPGEVNYSVPPLSLPLNARVNNLDQLAGSDAAYLFMERALLSWPGFSATDDMARPIAQIVRRLDGIPLAIELAAARIKILSAQDIAKRLDDRFRLLRGGTGALARQRTLEEAIDWSYDLLAEDEKTVFRRLAVFVGRFHLHAVENICSDDRILSDDLLDLLSRLIDKSLVLTEEHGGHMYYRLLESVREYSREKLASSGDYEFVSDRHLAHYLTIAETSEPQTRGAQGHVWLEKLDAEHENLRAALVRSQSSKDRTIFLRLAGALWYFWFERGYWTEGRHWLEQALEAHSGPDDEARCRALCAAGILAWRQGDNVRAEELAGSGGGAAAGLNDKSVRALALLIQGLVARRRDNYALAAQLHEDSLDFFQDIEDMWGIQESLRLLAINLWYQGECVRAAGLFQEGLERFRHLEDQRGIADSLHWLGRTAAYSGAFDVARSYLEECRGLYLTLGRPSGLAQTLYVMGRIESHGGNHEQARALLDESLALLRNSRDEQSSAAVLAFRGRVDVRLNDKASALKHLEESLRIRIRLGTEWDRWGLAECVEGMAELAVAQQRHETAARLLGICAVLRGQIGIPLPPIDRTNYERIVAEIKAALGDQRFQEAWRKGEGLSADEAPALLQPAS